MLTQEQDLAVTTDERRAVVCAGAGSGKTLLIVERCKELVGRGVTPESIVVLTFSRAAAEEIRERLGIYGRRMHVGTFHSVILSVMAKLRERPNVLDEEEAAALIDECAVATGAAISKATGIKYQKGKGNPTSWRKEMEARKPSQFLDVYLSKLAMRGDIDYVGIIRRGISLAQSGGFNCQYVIVDEAQDNDPLQWQFVRLLAESSHTLIVGDVNQCIHQWRGASPEEFEGLGWHTYLLTETFRCPQAVVDVANKIRHITLTLRTNKPGGNVVTSGDTLSLIRHAANAFQPEDMAVLCRYNDQADKWAEELEALGLPVLRRKPTERGPIFWLLRYLSNPSSYTARVKCAKVLQPYLSLTNDGVVQSICSSRQTSHVQQLTEAFLMGVGVSYGPAEILRSMNIPAALMPEAIGYSKKYTGETLDFWRQEELSDAPLPSVANSGITVGTIHGSKGLEWQCVFMPELSGRCTVEECRLFYVGTTRSKDTLVFPDGSNFQAYLNETN